MIMLACLVSLILVLGAFTAQNADDQLPQQIHLSLGKSHSEMVVTFTVYVPAKSQVAFGESESALNSLVTGPVTRFVDKGQRVHYIHRVTLKNLKPRTTYFYQCRVSSGKQSEVHRFKTLSDETDWSPRMLVFGDLGLFNGVTMPYMKREVDSGAVDLLFHNGDIAYNLCENNSKRGDKFMRKLEPMVSKVAYQTSPGNHETFKAECLQDYLHRFSMFDMTAPREMRIKSDHFYAFYLGPALIISINNEVYIKGYNKYFSATLKAEQEQWLVAVLKEANKPDNRARHPWIVVLGHQPMYCHSCPNEKCCTDEAAAIRTNLEDILYENGVDLAIWSHIHNYERELPVYKSKVRISSIEEPYRNPKAPVHIITGSAGCSEYIDYETFPRPAWNAFGNSQYGYGLLHFVNSTNLIFQQKAIIGGIGDTRPKLHVIDQIELIQEVHGPRESLSSD